MAAIIGGRLQTLCAHGRSVALLHLDTAKPKNPVAAGRPLNWDEQVLDFSEFPVRHGGPGGLAHSSGGRPVGRTAGCLAMAAMTARHSSRSRVPGSRM
jgi:hypothetical protein